MEPESNVGIRVDYCKPFIFSAKVPRGTLATKRSVDLDITGLRICFKEIFGNIYCHAYALQPVRLRVMRMLSSFFCLLAIFPFISSLAYAEDDFWVEMSYVEPGQLLRLEWEGKKIGVLFRAEEMIKALQSRYSPSSEKDNLGMTGVYRSLTSDYFVFFDQFNGSSCRLKYVYPGDSVGLLDPCSNIKFDFSGRSDTGLKLELPAYKMVSKTKLVFLDF